MKIYGGDLGARWRLVVNYTPRLLYAGIRATGTHFTGGRGAPEPVWTLWRKEKSLSFAGNRHPAIQLVPLSYTD
jgi:hypothetical protein